MLAGPSLPVVKKFRQPVSLFILQKVPAYNDAYTATYAKALGAAGHPTQRQSKSICRVNRMLLCLAKFRTPVKCPVKRRKLVPMSIVRIAPFVSDQSARFRNPSILTIRQRSYAPATASFTVQVGPVEQVRSICHRPDTSANLCLTGGSPNVSIDSAKTH